MLILLLAFLAAASPDSDVATWVESQGGRVTRDASSRVTAVNLRASWVTDTDLRALAQLPDLTHLDLSLTRITDQGMQELKTLPGIVDQYLDGRLIQLAALAPTVDEDNHRRR